MELHSSLPGASITLKWHTCTIDFSNAFIQAKLDAPVWIHLLHGFKSEHGYKKTCLCLKKSLYGLLVAPRLWSQHLLSALKKEGFVASKYDSCLLIKLNMLIVLCVDDAGVCTKNEHDIDELIRRLTKHGFELTCEGSFSEFLGIKFVHDKETGTITAKQQGLIKKILAATAMEDCNPNWARAPGDALPDGHFRAGRQGNGSASAVFPAPWRAGSFVQAACIVLRLLGRFRMAISGCTRREASSKWPRSARGSLAVSTRVSGSATTSCAARL